MLWRQQENACHSHSDPLRVEPAACNEVEGAETGAPVDAPRPGENAYRRYQVSRPEETAARRNARPRRRERSAERLILRQ